jgi:hypothetical protein
MRARARIAAERAAQKRAEARRRFLVPIAAVTSQLSNPSSPVAQAVDGSAKVIITAIEQVLPTRRLTVSAGRGRIHGSAARPWAGRRQGSRTTRNR